MIVFPNAKINIGLFVTEKRQDGFHNLETVFYPIELSDVLEIVRGEGKTGEYSFQNTGIDVACEAEKNLIVKAYHLLARDYSLPAVRIHLHKIIPYGAGLGGGSSDAAFMLKALDSYFELHIPMNGLLEYAARLGSDCAFFITDRPVFAYGKGEIMEETGLSLENYRIVLIKPVFGVSTPEAYAGIIPQKAKFDLRNLHKLDITEWSKQIGNDFENSVFAKYPLIGEYKQKLYQQGALFADMTGSGSAVYGLFEKNQSVKLDCPDCFVWESEM